MRRILLFVLLAAALCGAQKFATRKVSDEFIGAWKLVSFERRTPAGEVTYPMGPNPVGRLAYDPLGRMSAQLMRPDRPQWHGSGSADEKIAAVEGYFAYYGSYSVNAADHTVTHHVEACLNPNWVGGDQVRWYEFSGERLILRLKGPSAESKLVWERARP